MDKQKIKQLKRVRRKGRVRAKITGTNKLPRLSVFRSNKGMYLQLIDDGEGKTLVSV
ncbi:MAG: 50S ribosomal protein L18, partial [bacterium]|nr:50S ribosomal protein L18 [bacterium]